MTGAGALDVRPRVVVHVDLTAVTGSYSAAIHVVTVEVAAVTADGAARHGVVARHVAVVPAAGAAFVHVEALGAAVVFTNRPAMLHLKAAGIAAITLAANVAFVTAEALARLARVASFVIVTADEGCAEQQR